MNCEAGLAGGGGMSYDKIAGLYDLLDTLGSGHFAVVKLARHVFTGEKVAVKVIDKSKLDEVSRSHLYQEVRCMKLVQHPNVVRLYEVIDTHTKLYLILELGDGGDLYDYIMRHESGLSESLARDYFRQIVRAISYCHRLHVVHRDLKPENVVFFERLGVVKLTDFGFSNKFNPGQKLETSCGSLAYSAPEILLGDSYDAPAVDVWSLGVILFMLVCGQAPFQEANDSETLTMIMDCKYTISPHISNSCKRLIGRMLVREPEKRATLLEIASDPWVTAGGKATADDYDTPLVAREQLSEDDRALIVQKMVNGAIGTKEEILEALEKNEYNHLTATYYLFAERKLKCKRREELSHARRPAELGVRAQTTNLLAPPSVVPTARTPQDVPPRSRKCSIVREEEDDEEVSERSGGTGATRRGSRSEGRLCLSTRLPLATPQPPAVLADNLTKVNLEDKRLPLKVAPPLIPTIEIVHPRPPLRAEGEQPPLPPRTHRRRRAGSCSSSDLSDDDSEARKKRGNTEHDDVPPERTRRDSHDDSGDGRGGAGAGPGTSAPGPSAPAPRGDEPRGGNTSGGTRRRRAARHESRLRESRSLNRIAEVEEARGGLVALCGRPLLRLLARVPPAAQRRLHGLC